jgi:hypothetical protein
VYYHAENNLAYHLESLGGNILQLLREEVDDNIIMELESPSQVEAKRMPFSRILDKEGLGISCLHWNHYHSSHFPTVAFSFFLAGLRLISGTPTPIHQPPSNHEDHPKE